MASIRVITHQPGISVLKPRKTTYIITCSNKISSRKILHGFHSSNNKPTWIFSLKTQKKKKTHTITCSNHISSRKFCMAFIRVITHQPGISILKPRKTTYIITCSNKTSSRKILHGIHSSNNKPTWIFSLNTIKKKKKTTTYTIACNNQISSRKFCMPSIRVITHQPGILVLKHRKTAYIITCSNKICSRKILHGIHSSNNKPTWIFSLKTQKNSIYNNMQ